MNAFHHICLALANAATLAKPDYNSPFYLNVAEKYDIRLSVSAKREREVLGYYSVILDPIELRTPPCTRNVATLKRPMIVNTSYAVIVFVVSAFFSMTPRRESTVIDILTQPFLTYQSNKNTCQKVWKNMIT